MAGYRQIMKQPHYRITFTKESKDSRLKPFLNEMICQADAFLMTLTEFENGFLNAYRRVERTSIGSPDNECDRYIYEGKRDSNNRIFMYVYPPR